MASNGSATSWSAWSRPRCPTPVVTAQNGQPLAVSGAPTTYDLISDNSSWAGRRPLPRSGSSAQNFSGTTDSTGTATCNIAPVSESSGPIPRRRQLRRRRRPSDGQCGLHREPPRGDAAHGDLSTGTYNGATPVSATLVNTYTDQPVPNEPVTSTLNNTQTCTATTNDSGVATCPVMPTEPCGHLLADDVVPWGLGLDAPVRRTARRAPSR